LKRHLFTSGEIMYEKNRKQLKEGLFIAEYMEYDDVCQETEYICGGKLNGMDAEIRFRLTDDQLEYVRMKNAYKILMQSDLLNAC